MTPELRESVARIARYMCRGSHWVKTPKGPRHVKAPLTVAHLDRHCNGGPAIGLAPISPGTSATRIALVDLDAHKKDEMTWEEMATIGGRVMRALEARGMTPFAFRSGGGRGVHVYLTWSEAQDAYSVQQLLDAALADCGLRHGTKGVKAGEAERFPKQAEVGQGNYGSMWILPLAGESLPLDPETMEIKGYDYAEGMRQWPESRPVLVVPRPAVARPQESEPSPDLAEVRAALAAIPNDGNQSLAYDDWFKVICAIHYATGGSAEGLQLAHEFSARSPKYAPEFLDERVWPYVKDDRGGAVITDRTLFALARQHENVLEDFSVLPAEGGETAAGASWSSPPNGVAAPPAGNRFTPIPGPEFVKRSPPRWIIRDVLPQAELVAVFGPAGVGKSFLTLDIVGSVMRGAPWRGLKVRQGHVIYIAAEGSGGFRNRLKAYQTRHEASLAGVDVIADAPNLLKADDVKELIAAVKALSPVALIVVDTLAQVMQGVDENSADGMGKALGHCKALYRATGATVLLIHHAGKDASKGLRGWSGFGAACDAIIEVTRSGEHRLATVEKMKDGMDGAAYGFRLEVVPIGTDEDGVPINSCVVEHLDGEREVRNREPAGAHQKTVWTAIQALAALGGEDMTVGAVIDESIRGMEYDPSKKDRRRERVTTAIGSLKENGWITVSDNRVLIRGGRK